MALTIKDRYNKSPIRAFVKSASKWVIVGGTKPVKHPTKDKEWPLATQADLKALKDQGMEIFEETAKKQPTNASS